MRKRRATAPQAQLTDMVRQVTQEYRAFLAMQATEAEDAKAFASRHAAARAALAHLAELLTLTAGDTVETHPDCKACRALDDARHALALTAKEDTDGEPGGAAG